MLRAKDKLNEAEFFLSKIVETDGKPPEFQYYLSACVTACRSVPLILQKDLRAKFGTRFEDWWDQQKTTMPTETLSFEVIRDLRNIFLKEGNRLPLIEYEMKFDNGIVDSVLLKFDTSREQVGFQGMTINMHKNATTRKINVEVEENATEQEKRDAINGAVQKDMQELLEEILERLTEEIATKSPPLFFKVISWRKMPKPSRSLT